MSFLDNSSRFIDIICDNIELLYVEINNEEQLNKLHNILCKFNPYEITKYKEYKIKLYITFYDRFTYRLLDIIRTDIEIFDKYINDATLLLNVIENFDESISTSQVDCTDDFVAQVLYFKEFMKITHNTKLKNEINYNMLINKINDM